MQLIVRCDSTAEEYIAGNMDQRVARPAVCPHCGRPACLRVLGHYKRGISSNHSGVVLVIRVRRFRCRLVGKTVSMLPAFAHPYRLVGAAFIEYYFSGHRGGFEMQWWSPLLQRYWRRFEYWLPNLLDSVGATAGLSPPIHNRAAAWKILRRKWGPVPRMTHRLVSEFRITIFGRYRCHDPAGANP